MFLRACLHAVAEVILAKVSIFFFMKQFYGMWARAKEQSDSNIGTDMQCLKAFVFLFTL